MTTIATTTKTPTIADITNARRCAEQNTDVTGLIWGGNVLWSEAAAMNWQRLNDGVSAHVVAAPQPEDGRSVEELLDQGMVGIYRR